MHGQLTHTYMTEAQGWGIALVLYALGAWWYGFVRAMADAEARASHFRELCDRGILTHMTAKNEDAARLGRLGGKARSEAKRAANREKARTYWASVKAGWRKHRGRGKSST